MTDLIFSILVGFATISVLSWLIYEPKPKATTTTTKTVAVAPTVINTPVIDEEINLWDTASSEVAIAIVIDEPVETIEADETAETTTLTLVNKIEIDKLPVGICKKIAGKLTKQHPEMKISQTVNGTSKPVSQLRAEIKNRITKEPQMLMKIIEDVLVSESKESKLNTKKPNAQKLARNRSLKAAS